MEQELNDKIRNLEALFRQKQKIEKMMNDHQLHDRIYNLSFDLSIPSIKTDFFIKLHDDHKSVIEKISGYLVKG